MDKEDHGAEVSWNDANAYCQGLSLAGYSAWRLPKADELRAMYDTTSKGNIRGGIQLSGWDVWSGTHYGSDVAMHVAVSFGIGQSGRTADRALRRALCVRRDGDQAKPGRQQ